MRQVSFDKTEYEYDGSRDIETKKAFSAYLRAFPEQRFFQAITNFVRERMDLSCWSLCIAESPDKTDGLKDVFYIEGDKVLKKMPRIMRKERIDKMDLAGRVFGYLTVEKPYTEGVDKKHSYWVCKCKCGNPCIKRQDALFKTPIPSCGCHKQEATSKQWSAQLAGRRFGNLTVIRRVKSKDRRALWECKCDCGETFYCFSRYLLAMGVTSCGCKTKSSGELKIRKLLKSQNILFKEQFSFSDCNGRQRPLRFDFAILDEKGKPKIMVEVNGPQHYKAIEFFGGEERLQQLKEYDQIKRDYCKTKKLRLVELEQTSLMKMSDREILEALGVKNMRAIVEHCPWMEEDKPAVKEEGKSIINICLNPACDYYHKETEIDYDRYDDDCFLTFCKCCGLSDLDTINVGGK